MISDQAPEWPVERLWLWNVLFPPIRTIVRALVHIRVEGRENLPARGPFIIVSNHINWKDPPLITIILDLSVRYMAKIQARCCEANPAWVSSPRALEMSRWCRSR